MRIAGTSTHRGYTPCRRQRSARRRARAARIDGVLIPDANAKHSTVLGYQSPPTGLDMALYLSPLIVVAVCLVGWIIGEIKDMRTLRVSCVAMMLVFVCIVPYRVGTFLGGANASLAVTGATHTFVSTAGEQLDAGNAGRVRGELRVIAESTNETYEGEWFAEQMRAATERLTAP